MIPSIIWTSVDSDNSRDAQNSSIITDKFDRIIEKLSDEELRVFSIDLLNAFLLKDRSSNCVKLLDDSVVDIKAYFALVEKSPIIQIFFDPVAVGVPDNNSLHTLENFFSEFFDHIMSIIRTEKAEIHFAQLCILSWHECFIHPSQQLLGEFISHLISRKFSSIIGWYSSSNRAKHDAFSMSFHSILLVSIIQLVERILTEHGYYTKTAKSTKISSLGKFSSDNLRNVYERTFETLSDSAAQGSEIRIDNLESFVTSAFNFLTQFCTSYENVILKEPAFEELVPEFQSDPKLKNRLRLGYAYFLARACRFLNLLLESGGTFFTSSEWQDFLLSDLPRFQKFVHTLLVASGRIPDQFDHTDLITWNIDRSLCVKDYALAFLGNSMFDDALCPSKIIPRLLRQISLLTEDSDVTMAVIRKVNYLRFKKLPTNHYEELLKELFSILSPDLKSDILDLLHNKSKKLLTPLPSDENKFRSYMRTFCNRLSAGPSVSEQQRVSKAGKLWRDTLFSSSVSKEILLDADLLLLTRPLDFLVELVRFPILQNSMSLFSVLHKILNHVNYAFAININDMQMPILQALMAVLLSLFDSEIFEGREHEDGNVWRGEGRQRIALMRYLPRSGNLDPIQISLATQAARFSASAVGSTILELADDADDGEGNDDSFAKIGLRKLWICAIACVLDQPGTWPHLPLFDNDESSVLKTRTRVEIFIQSLALLLLPRPPSDIPLDLVAPLCLRFLERLRSPLAVRLCVALFSSTSREMEQLQNILTSPEDPGRRLFLQSVDFLPANLVENATIRLPRSVTQSRLVDVDTLNDSAKNRFKFISSSPQTSTSLDSFARSLSASDFEEILQLVTLCDSIWHITVNHIRTVPTQIPEIRSVWSGLSTSSLILAFYTFLHRIAVLDEADATECWARAMGFLDQLISGGIINMPYRLRSADPKTPQSQGIYLGNYRGSLDLFDFIFTLLRLVNIATEGSAGSQILVGRLCQTLAALGQRLIERIRGHLHESELQTRETEVLTQQVVLVFAELRAYVEIRDVQANSPLKRLILSLDIVENVLLRQREDQVKKGYATDKDDDEDDRVLDE